MKTPPLLRATLLAAVPLVGISHAVPTIAGGNGSFETTSADPNNPGPTWSTWGLEDVTIDGWTVTKPDGSAFNPTRENAPWFANGFSGMGTASDGNFFVNVEGGVKWRLKASLEGLTIGTSYTVSFDTRRRGGSGNFDISIDTATPAGGFNLAPTDTANWIPQSFTFVAEAGTHTLTISNQDTVGLGFFVDKLGIAETPPDPWTAGDGVWTGGDGEWSTATNWQSDTIGQGVDKTATFNGATAVTATVNVNRPIGALLFSGANHTLAAGSGSLTLDGATLFTTPTVTVADGFTATIAAALNGGEGLLKSGTGTLVLGGTNSYSGSTAISQGTLIYQGGGFASGTHTIASGAALEFKVPTGTYNAASTTINGAGTLRKTGAGNLIWPATLATFALQSGALIDVQEGTFTGGSFANENWSGNLSDLNIAAGATFNTVEANVRLNKITGSGTLASGFGGAGYQNLTIGVEDGSSTFNGVIANANAPANLVKAGSGTITLAGLNTYTGNTTINGGTLELADDAQLAFVVSNSTSNSISGSGIASIKGDFAINTAAVTGTTGGSWPLVNLGSLDPASSFASSFTVIGFDDLDNDGIWTMSDAKGDWSFSEASGELSLVLTDDYLAWSDTYGLAAGSENGDLDGDGMTNFEEYAFGLLPNSGASVNPITTPLDKISGTFSYTRRLQSKTDLVYTVRSSTTLAANGWTNLVKDTDYTESVSAPAGDQETVTITLTPAPTSDKLFIQIQVEQL